jgi:hypothetical protein
MQSAPSNCPVCSRTDATLEYLGSQGFDAERVNCRSCGEFYVSRLDKINLSNGRGKWNPSHVSALLREQTIRGSRFWLRDGGAPVAPPAWSNNVPIDLTELLEQWPRTVPDRINRALCNLARLSLRGGHCIKDIEPSLLFSETGEEGLYNLEALKGYGFLDIAKQHDGYECVVKPDGWAHFEKLTRGASAPENPAFVAMWFGDDPANKIDEKKNMDEAFAHAIEPAIMQAGYRVLRADLQEHNDWIMDEVMGDIRLAPFIVADFTGHRNGVYFEAGFARGLGIPMIPTC